MRLRHTDPHDVDYISSVLAAAENGFDVWDELPEFIRNSYRTMADAALRAIEIDEVRQI